MPRALCDHTSSNGGYHNTGRIIINNKFILPSIQQGT